MKDVARRAGVSTATVSHVINNSRFVSDPVKQIVFQAMEELQYRPNAIAKSLRQKSTHTIGLVISDIANPFFTSLVRAVEDVANRKGYNLILCNTDEQPDKERVYLDVLMQKQVDGIIVAPTTGNTAYFRELAERNFPLVFIDRHLDEVNVPAVLVDSEDGAFQAVSHLIRLGHRRIGLVTGLTTVTTTGDRRRGYERALAEFGLPLDPALIRQGNSQVPGGQEGGLALLRLPLRPTAIFATNNLMTIGVMRALHDEGLQCPQDLAIVGFDDFDWASSFRPYLTTVAQPVYDLGKAAADLLLARLERKSKPKQRVVLKGTLIVRESCGAAASSTL